MVADVSKPNDRYRATLATLFQMLSAGEIAPRVADSYQLADAAAAHARLEQGGHAGKVVLLTGRS